MVSTDKLYDLTVQKTDGKPSPDFDTFIWGWGGDPYNPSFLLSILTTGEIGGSSDAFYSNKEYDKLYREQTTIFDVAQRKEVIQRMVALTQRDLPYLVLSEDPQLQAYRTDRINAIAPICPAETGDLFCDQVSYEGILALDPIEGASSGDTGSGNAGLAGLVGLVVGFIGGVIVTRRRRLTISRSRAAGYASAGGRRDVRANAILQSVADDRLGRVGLVLEQDLTGLDADDLHEQIVLHAALIADALVGRVDLAGHEIARADLLAPVSDLASDRSRPSTGGGLLPSSAAAF